MSSQILIFLLDTVLGLFSLALLLRFYMQLLRAPYHNPLSKFLVAITNFIVLPVRRVIPGWKGLDLATLMLAWLTQFIILAGVNILQGYELSATTGSTFIGFGLVALIELIRMTLYIMLIMIIVQAVLSWINPYSPLAPILDSFTRPILDIFRRLIPPIANVDLSPLFAIIMVQLLLMVVAGVQQEISIMF